MFSARYYCVYEQIYDKFNTPIPDMKRITKRKKVREFDAISHLSKLSDRDLVEIFELTVQRYYTCM